MAKQRPVMMMLRAEAPGIVGDAYIPIGPEHPEYEVWKRYWEEIWGEDIGEGSSGPGYFGHTGAPPRDSEVTP
jgi:hypothetical protein